MKKVYAILVMTLLCSLGAVAGTKVKLTVNVDNPSAVKQLKIQYEEISPVLQSNQIETEIRDDEWLGHYMVAELKDGYIFGAVDYSNTTSTPIVSKTRFSVYVQKTDNGMVVNLNTIDLAEARTRKLTLNIDNPAKATVREKMSEADYTLVAGENKIRVIPDPDNCLTIKPISYYKPLYRVERNGVEVEENADREYVIVPSDNDVIDVKADFPDTDFPVTFTYDEGAEEVITGVNVDNVAVAGFDRRNLSVKAGSEVSMRLNDTDFQISGVTVNGREIEGTYSVSFIPRGETTVHISAHPYGNITAYVDIDDPANVIVYKGYAYDNQVLTLNGGENRLELPERSAKIAVCNSKAGYVTEVSDGTKTYEFGPYNLIQLTDGMRLKITTKALQRDNKFVFWIDSRELCTSLSLTLGSLDFRSYIEDEIVDGYNEFLIDPGIDNPVQLYWYAGTSEYNNVFVNDEKIDPIYPGGKMYDLPQLSQGTVVKTFAASDPEWFDVTFEVPADVVSKVIKDRVRDLADLSPRRELRGTELKISRGDDRNIAVSVNGEPAAADASGAFTVIINKDTKIAITNETAGVEDVSINATGASDVYNLQGVLVLKAASDDEISSLPAGIYVAGGRKIVVK